MKNSLENSMNKDVDKTEEVKDDKPIRVTPEEFWKTLKDSIKDIKDKIEYVFYQ